MITAEIKARAAAIEAARPRVDEVSKLLKGGSIGVYLSQKNGKSGSILIYGQQEPTVEPMGKAQTAARDLLLFILDLVTHILGNPIFSASKIDILSSNLLYSDYVCRKPRAGWGVNGGKSKCW